MKKLSTIFTVASLGLMPLANANETPTKTTTKGNYVGLELLRTDVKFHEDWTRNTIKVERHNRHFSDNDIGLGVDYKYAFNFDRVFIAPGFFYEQNNTKVGGSGVTDSSDFANNNKLKISNRYGVKADLGYDLTDRFSPYITGGYSRIGYTATNAITRNFVTTPSSKSSTVGDWFCGVGLKYRYSNTLSFGAEYNTQAFTVQTNVAYNNNIAYSGAYKTKLSVMKLGAFYNF